MRTTKILTVALMLATLAAGCNKDKDRYINIFAGSMSVSDNKVLINPSDIPDGAYWIAGETVMLNGTEYEIAGASENYHLIDPENSNMVVQAMDEVMYAMYPGGSFGGNDVDVNYNTGEIVLNRLVIRIMDNGTQEMAFPMAGRADAGETNLYFNHLTAGMRIDLHNQGSSAVNVAKLKVVAQSEEAADNLSYTDVRTFTARWAVQGPTMPTGNVGENEDVVDAKYASEMNFDLKSGNNDYVTISNGDNKPFCIPVTLSSVRKLVITGYSEDDTELFHVAKDFGSNITVYRNRMYTVPVININQ
jgi:hypothetical protein